MHVRFGELLGASSRSHAAYIANYLCHNAVLHTYYRSYKAATFVFIAALAGFVILDFSAKNYMKTFCI
jgi:hypothetical protein